MLEAITLSHWVAGKPVSAAPTLEHSNPADPDDFIVRFPNADEDFVSAAVESAKSAMPRMLARGIEARADMLQNVSQHLMRDAAQIADLIARETGKTVRDAVAEVSRAARLFSFFAGETLRNIGERFDSTRVGVAVEVGYEPVGVVGLITPWNFPIAIPAWKIAPALAFGNSVVWKPSELSSATASALMQILVASGAEPGSVNLVLGDGRAGSALTAHPDVDAVSFTGSEKAGKFVRDACSARGARVQLEMGGVNGLIVLADADLDVAVECALNGAFFAAGQRCTATSRIIIEEPIANRFVERLSAAVDKLVIGNPRDKSTDLGPLVSFRQKEIISHQVNELEKGGLTLVFGGVKATRPHAFFSPTLFDRAPAQGVFETAEIFGPVAAVVRVNSFEEALRSLNATRFGLAAGICTRSLRFSTEFKAKAKAGLLMVNLPTAGVDYHAPFGGIRGSSYGPREQGREARTFYTNVKTIYQRS